MCYFWEMVLKYCPEVLFSDMSDWKGMCKRAEEVSSMNGYVRNCVILDCILSYITLIIKQQVNKVMFVILLMWIISSNNGRQTFHVLKITCY
jgi:hypothetical protein